jgi:uncharacterized protein YggU (UPF0235/DUF167 family)
MHVTIRVYPRARTTRVGGRYGTGEPPVLIVRVSAPAADGRANLAAIRAVAKDFGVPTSAVRLATGARHRTKILEVAGADPDRLEQLLRLDAPE